MESEIKIKARELLIDSLNALRKGAYDLYKKYSEKCCAMEESDFTETEEGARQYFELCQEADTYYNMEKQIQTLIEFLESLD